MDVREVRVAVVSDDGVACAADALTHVAAHLAEADETELHQLFLRSLCGVPGTWVPGTEPNGDPSCTTVGIRAHTYAPTWAFATGPALGPVPGSPAQPLRRTGMIRYL
ncbi:hypothetical protein GCM10017776_22940 [Streptomyces griseoluteus]|nr:hypothetical protein GCM10017776_22940 [Streptomyces griseoluteus]